MLTQRIKMHEVVRDLDIHEVTDYRWQQEYVGRRVNDPNRLKELGKRELAIT